MRVVSVVTGPADKSGETRETQPGHAIRRYVWPRKRVVLFGFRHDGHTQNTK